MLQLYGEITKVVPRDDGTIEVHGIASTPSRDDADEVITASAMRGAIPDYMKWGAVREMHGASAAGTAIEMEVGDDEVTRVVAHIVDPVAIQKVKAGVYKGISVGGKVTKRNSDDRRTIDAIKLVEVSLVDRPCNPEARIDCWKADDASSDEEDLTMAEWTPTNADVRARATDLAKAAGKPPARYVDYVLKARTALVAEHDEPDPMDLGKRDFSDKQRKTLADSGKAMPDGSFPIENEEDLHNAVRAVGRASNPGKAKAHIIARAKSMGMTSALPDDWTKVAETEDNKGTILDDLPTGEPVIEQPAAKPAADQAAAEAPVDPLVAIEAAIAAAKAAVPASGAPDAFAVALKALVGEDTALLQKASDILASLGAPAPETKIADEVDALIGKVATLETEKEDLARMLLKIAPEVDEITGLIKLLVEQSAERDAEIDALKADLVKFGQEPRTPKTAASANLTTISKEADAAGAGAAGDQPLLSAEDFGKLLDALPEDERGLLMLRAALTQPREVMARRSAAA